MSNQEPCKLCGVRPAIRGSHVISALVVREIKADSPTGFLRNPYKPNLRLQDSDKAALLCTECEQRFSAAEGEFAANIFQPFHRNDQASFRYGPWLHYFMTSLAWRTLLLDLPGFRFDGTVPTSITTTLDDSLARMQAYLLGSQGLAASIRNHAVAWTVVGNCSPQLAAIGPNVAIRRSVFGYTLVDKKFGYAAVLHNLAGFVCVLNIRANPQDVWINTKVSPTSGKVVQPQRAGSWIFTDMFQQLIQQKEGFEKMSDTQQAKIDSAVRCNSQAPAMRFWNRDRQVQPGFE